MMGLWLKQHELLTHIVRERSMGREPGPTSVAHAFGLANRGAAHSRLTRLYAYLGRERIEAIVPRGPDGARLRFIPIDGQA